MKKTLILIAAAIMGFSTPILAQSDDNEKEITVTNAQGKKEVIDLPEAMTTGKSPCFSRNGQMFLSHSPAQGCSRPAWPEKIQGAGCTSISSLRPTLETSSCMISVGWMPLSHSMPGMRLM